MIVQDERRSKTINGLLKMHLSLLVPSVWLCLSLTPGERLAGWRLILISPACPLLIDSRERQCQMSSVKVIWNRGNVSCRKKRSDLEPNVLLTQCSAKIFPRQQQCVFTWASSVKAPAQDVGAGAEHNVESVSRIKEFLALCLSFNQCRLFFWYGASAGSSRYQCTSRWSGNDKCGPSLFSLSLAWTYFVRKSQTFHIF